MTRIATRIRRNLLRADLEVGAGDGRHDDMLCDLAVRALAEVLGPVTYHVGYVFCPAKWALLEHWWISVDGWMVDIASAQFGKRPVIVCRTSEFPWRTDFASREADACRAYMASTRTAEDLAADAAQYGSTPEVLEERAREHDRRVLRRFRQLMAGNGVRVVARGRKSQKKRAREARRVTRRRG